MPQVSRLSQLELAEAVYGQTEEEFAFWNNRTLGHACDEFVTGEDIDAYANDMAELFG